MLQKLLGSQARAEILKKLFTGDGRCFYLREFSRVTGISAPLLSRELRNLAAMGLILITEDGNRINFTANKEHILYSVLCELIDKSCGPIELLRKIFTESSADLIFVFGTKRSGVFLIFSAKLQFSAENDYLFTVLRWLPSLQAVSRNGRRSC